MATKKPNFSEIRAFMQGLIDEVRNSTNEEGKEVNGELSVKLNIYKDGNRFRICDRKSKNITEKIELHLTKAIKINKLPPLHIHVSKTRSNSRLTEK